MKAWLYRRYGGPGVLEFAEVDVPQPRRGELRLRVQAFSLNALDWKLRSGQFRLMTRGGLPRGVGYDVAGVVDEPGPQTRLARGTPVVGMLDPFGERRGAAAEFACVAESSAAVVPPGLAMQDAAALPGAGITALQALRKARRRPGQRVLVLGASGGVGSFAVLLAKLQGLEVTAVASAAGQPHLASLAPHRAIDASQQDWRRLGERFDLVLDCTGATTFRQCLPLLQPDGAYANTLPGGALFGAAAWAAITSRRRVIAVMAKPNAPDIGELAGLAAQGRLRAPVTRVGGMGDVPALLEELEAGRGRGKFVVAL